MPANRHYVPLSVRYGNRRTRLRWWWKGRKEAFALWLCPWLTPMKVTRPRTSEAEMKARLPRVDDLV